MSKYWKVKEGTDLHDWCAGYLARRTETIASRDKLCEELLGTQRDTSIVIAGDQLTGFTYSTGELPDDLPDERLKIARHPLASGERWYEPNKRKAAGKQLLQRMEELSFESNSPLCDMLCIPPITWGKNATYKRNSPGMRYDTTKGEDVFFLAVIDSWDGDERVTRVSDIEYEQLLEKKRENASATL